jgi:hypothetical protein
MGVLRKFSLENRTWDSVAGSNAALCPCFPERFTTVLNFRQKISSYSVLPLFRNQRGPAPSIMTSTERERVVIDGKTYIKREPRLNIGDMLVNGAPGQPSSKFEKYGYPVVLAILFGISLMIFHYAPHEYSKIDTLQQGFIMNQKPVNKKKLQKYIEIDLARIKAEEMEAATRKAAEISMDPVQVDASVEPEEHVEEHQETEEHHEHEEHFEEEHHEEDEHFEEAEEERDQEEVEEENRDENLGQEEHYEEHEQEEHYEEDEQGEHEHEEEHYEEHEQEEHEDDERYEEHEHEHKEL